MACASLVGDAARVTFSGHWRDGGYNIVTCVEHHTSAVWVTFTCKHVRKFVAHNNSKNGSGLIVMCANLVSVAGKVKFLRRPFGKWGGHNSETRGVAHSARTIQVILMWECSLENWWHRDELAFTPKTCWDCPSAGPSMLGVWEKKPRIIYSFECLEGGLKTTERHVWPTIQEQFKRAWCVKKPGNARETATRSPFHQKTLRLGHVRVSRCWKRENVRMYFCKITWGVGWKQYSDERGPPYKNNSSKFDVRRCWKKLGEPWRGRNFIKKL